MAAANSSVYGCTVCYGSGVTLTGQQCLCTVNRYYPHPGFSTPPTIPPVLGKAEVPQMHNGWECPKCYSVYAPFVTRCTICGPKSQAT